MSIRVQSLKTCIARSQVSWICVRLVCFIFLFQLPRVFGCTHTIHCALQLTIECCEFERFSPQETSLGCQDSACVEVMTTLHGSAPSLLRRTEGCIPPEGMIASTKGSFKAHPYPFRATLTSQVEPQIIRLGLTPYMWVHLRAFKASIATVQILILLLQSSIEGVQRSV